MSSRRCAPTSAGCGSTDLSLRYVDEHGGRDRRRRAALRRPRLGRRRAAGLAGRAGSTGRDSRREVADHLRASAGARRRASSPPARDGGRRDPLWLLDRLFVRPQPPLPGALADPAGPAAVLAAGRPGGRRRPQGAAAAGAAGWSSRCRATSTALDPGAGHAAGRLRRDRRGHHDRRRQSDVPGRPVHIFVNPQVFDPLGPRGSQIVMSHEATHVATGRRSPRCPPGSSRASPTTSRWPTSTCPSRSTASQILAQVRKARSAAAPARQARSSTRRTRHSARRTSRPGWPAGCSAEKYGEQRLIAFYRASDRAGSTARPVPLACSAPTQQAFTRAWRRTYLRGLAGDVTGRAAWPRPRRHQRLPDPRRGGIESFVLALCQATAARRGRRLHRRRCRATRSTTRRCRSRSTATPARMLLPDPGGRAPGGGGDAPARLRPGAVRRQRPLGLLAAVAAPCRRAARTVALTHGHEVWWARLPGARRLLRRIGDDVDVMTYVSEWCRDHIAPALSPGGPRADACGSPPASTPTGSARGAAGAAVRRRLGLGPDRPVVVCVARLVRARARTR